MLSQRSDVRKSTEDNTNERSERMKTKKPKAKDLAREMYLYFTSYDDRGVPSFSKFARSVGLTTADLINLRKHNRFDRAYRECEQIRRDYLIDRALDKRFDSAFTKYLLSCEDERSANEETNDFVLRLEVKE